MKAPQDPARCCGQICPQQRNRIWRTDTATGLTGILLTQRMVSSPAPAELVQDFWSAAYAAA